MAASAGVTPLPLQAAVNRPNTRIDAPAARWSASIFWVLPNSRSLAQLGAVLSEESTNEIAEFAKGIGGIDSDPQVGAVVEALRIPRGQGANFVDHPTIVTVVSSRSVLAGHVAETLRLSNSLRYEEFDIVEEESAAMFGCDLARRAACRDVGRLGQNPRIAKNASSDEYAINTLREPVDDLAWLDAVAASEHWN